jgi:hypothetical protein
MKADWDMERPRNGGNIFYHKLQRYKWKQEKKVNLHIALGAINTAAKLNTDYFVSILDTVQPGKVLYQIGAYDLPTADANVIDSNISRFTSASSKVLPQTWIHRKLSTCLWFWCWQNSRINVQNLCILAVFQCWSCFCHL